MTRHKCFDALDKRLAGHNTRLLRNLLDENMVFIETERVEKRRGSRAKTAIATFCPFCGKRVLP